MPEERLPYVFDLLYDLKHMDEVKAIAAGEPRASSATPEDLKKLFISQGMEVPECLENVHVPEESKVVWICKDGTWQYHEPPYEEKYKYYRAIIPGWEGDESCPCT